MYVLCNLQTLASKILSFADACWEGGRAENPHASEMATFFMLIAILGVPIFNKNHIVNSGTSQNFGYGIL